MNKCTNGTLTASMVTELLNRGMDLSIYKTEEGEVLSNKVIALYNGCVKADARRHAHATAKTHRANKRTSKGRGTPLASKLTSKAIGWTKAKYSELALEAAEQAEVEDAVFELI